MGWALDLPQLPKTLVVSFVVKKYCKPQCLKLIYFLANFTCLSSNTSTVYFCCYEIPPARSGILDHPVNQINNETRRDSNQRISRQNTYTKQDSDHGLMPWKPPKLLKCLIYICVILLLNPTPYSLFHGFLFLENPEQASLKINWHPFSQSWEVLLKTIDGFAHRRKPFTNGRIARKWISKDCCHQKNTGENANPV